VIKKHMRRRTSSRAGRREMDKDLNERLATAKPGEMVHCTKEELKGLTSDGSTASYYEVPPGFSQLQQLISYKNMNAQMGEIFRATYRYGQVAHSDQLRDIRKIAYYAKAEEERLLALRHT
jgi:hypothetical protein